MTKVMIVEDDKLARRGIIASVQWSQFHMQIVYDTGNGHSALEYLKENPVDLIITDIAMPIMSGMELLREVKKNYPSIQVVVLTMYQDFKYVQEALRLGALDYIGKYQLEKEEINDVIEKISIRLSEMKTDTIPSNTMNRSGACYAVISLSEPDTALQIFFLTNSLVRYAVNRHSTLFYTPPENILLKHPEKAAIFQKSLNEQPLSNTMIIKLPDANNFNDTFLLEMLPFDQSDYFYIFHNGYYEIPVSRLVKEKRAVNYANYQRCKDSLLSLNWIYDTEQFENAMKLLREGRIPYARLIHLLDQVVGKLQNSYSFLEGLETIVMPDDFLCFDYAKEWLYHIGSKVRTEINSQSYSPYVIECLNLAIQIIRTEFDTPLLSDDVAKRIHLSRSYFSQIFKKKMNISFNHYLRDVRMDKAKDLLIKTNYSLKVIAEKIGYTDEKYFSRLFRSSAGMTPGEFRSNYKDRHTL